MEPIADICIYGKMEDVFPLLMKKLDMKIPPFKREMHAEVMLGLGGEKKVEFLSVNGCDENKNPYSCFKTIEVQGEKTHQVPLKDDEKQADSVYNIKFSFMGNYKEPELILQFPRALLTPENKFKVHVRMVYNVESGKWEETVCLVDKKEPIQIENNFSEQST